MGVKDPGWAGAGAEVTSAQRWDGRDPLVGSAQLNPDQLNSAQLNSDQLNLDQPSPAQAAAPVIPSSGGGQAQLREVGTLGSVFGWDRGQGWSAGAAPGSLSPGSPGPDSDPGISRSRL